MRETTKKELETLVESYRDKYLDSIGKLGRAEVKFEEARDVIIELYYSSFWDSDRLQDDTAEMLWSKVKKVFDLQDNGPDKIYINSPKVGD